MAGVEIKNFTRRRSPAPGVLFSTIANDVLPGWDISLVFVGTKRAQNLNKQLRGKDYIPNVLSYAIGKKNGEIFICLFEAEKQAPSFHLKSNAYCLYLFIHGLLHVKGWAHGAKMEACEQKLLKRYVPKNSDRHRHRHAPDQAGGRRRGKR